MWVKRTESEVAEERRQQRQSRLRAAALFGAFVTVVTTFFYGWAEAGRRGRITVPTGELLLRLRVSVVVGAVATWVFYKFERKRPIMICPKCEATKYDDNLAGCSCGGHFEKIEEMKYVKASVLEK